MTCWLPNCSSDHDTRHPNPDRRPEFSVIVTRLNQPDYVLLKLPQDGKKDALSLKAPLRVSHDLYTDLQNKYSSK